MFGQNRRYLVEIGEAVRVPVSHALSKGVAGHVAIADGNPERETARETVYAFGGGGMYLLVLPDGNKYWRMDYRYGGKRRTLAISVYPEVSLQQAREKRTVWRRN